MSHGAQQDPAFQPLASIAAAFLEPDPTIEWDNKRINSLRQALTSLASPNA